MNKGELVDAIAKNAGLSKADAGKALNAFVSSVSGSLKKGNAVQLIGFGTFSISKRAARKGVNPRNPTETINIPAMNLPAFKAGKTLKDAVR